MVKQNNYDFRKEMLEKHKKNLMDTGFVPSGNMVEVTGEYVIAVPESAQDVLMVGAEDLRDYLFTSMKRSLLLVQMQDPAAQPGKTIVVGTAKQLGREWNKEAVAASYEITVEEGKIVVCGLDERGCAQGCYWLEDQMSNVRAPFLPVGEQYHAPAFSPRMIHSGFGIDQFPDEHISAIAHAGMDAVLVFVKDVNITTAGYLDFNNLIYRAARYGVDVYAYSYYKSDMHPEDEGAFEHYNASYGKLFEQCPGLKGIVLVGESVEFPSKDPRVSKLKYYNNRVDGLPTGKITAGWFPCTDYYKWIDMLKQVIYPHKPDADIVFWTYNWGWQPQEDRLKLIDSLPTDISLMVTFEMFETRKVDDVVMGAADYTISFTDPGSYFLSEAKRAKERGIRLYSQANSGGLTWDFGVIPYDPFPEKWGRRYECMMEAKREFGLCGIMESHHFGFWPSFISRIEKLMFTAPFLSKEEALETVAAELYGKKNVEQALKAWHLISEAHTYYISSDADQYGPFRIGPAYPFVLGSNVEIPSVPYAHFGGNAICNPNYGDGFGAGDYYTRAAGLLQQRLPGEIRSLNKMHELLCAGRAELEALAEKLEGFRKEEILRLINMLRFMENTITTGTNVKAWALCKRKLGSLTDPKELLAVVDEMIDIAKREIVNAEDTIPIVQVDSRLGWEPSMEYLGDERHLRWKIKQVTQVLEWELASYRNLFVSQIEEGRVFN